MIPAVDRRSIFRSVEGVRIAFGVHVPGDVVGGLTAVGLLILSSAKSGNAGAIINRCTRIDS
jgi:hypothetical protein